MTTESVATVDAAEKIAHYYSCPEVRDRIAEYCGGTSTDPTTFTCHTLAGFGGRAGLREEDGAPVRAANDAWPGLLSQGVDICRSLGDRRGALLHLDLDYVNPADPGEPFEHPEHCFADLEPIHELVVACFREYGLRPIALLTARGYHYTCRAPVGSPLFVALGCEGGGLGSTPRCSGEPSDVGGAQWSACSHVGAGKLLEFVAHLVMRRARRLATLVTTLADVPPPGNEPFVCLDLSAYADPLDTRHLRCAFSTNQKASAWSLTRARSPFVVVLPRGRTPLAGLLGIRSDPQEAACFAAAADARIPDTVAGIGLLEDYRSSLLGRFHRYFDSGPEVMEPGAWRWTYESLDLSKLPACVALPLEHPNPLLLRPPYLRSVALVLWALGWHPRSIAGLVRSKFESDHGWGDQWRRYDAAMRAAFYVRLFCGALVTGDETPLAVTCAAQASRGLCEPERCTSELQQLMARVPERLAKTVDGWA